MRKLRLNVVMVMVKWYAPLLNNCFLSPVLLLPALLCNDEVRTLKTTFEPHQVFFSGSSNMEPRRETGRLEVERGTCSILCVSYSFSSTLVFLFVSVFFPAVAVYIHHISCTVFSKRVVQFYGPWGRGKGVGEGLGRKSIEYWVRVEKMCLQGSPHSSPPSIRRSLQKYLKKAPDKGPPSGGT